MASVMKIRQAKMSETRAVTKPSKPKLLALCHVSIPTGLLYPIRTWRTVHCSVQTRSPDIILRSQALSFERQTVVKHNGVKDYMKKTPGVGVSACLDDNEDEWKKLYRIRPKGTELSAPFYCSVDR